MPWRGADLRWAGAAVDVVVVTPGDIACYRDSHALVIKPALNEGRVVYEAAGFFVEKAGRA